MIIIRTRLDIYYKHVLYHIYTHQDVDLISQLSGQERLCGLHGQRQILLFL